MGDLVMRISVFVQRGFICQRCGTEIDGEMSGEPRCCSVCQQISTDQDDTAAVNELQGRRLTVPRT